MLIKQIMTTKSKKPLNSLAMGTWNMAFTWSNQDRDEANKALQFAINKGINVIDTAPIYGRGESESFLGNFLNNNINIINKREDIFIASKCGLAWRGKKVYQDISKDSIRHEIEQSLKRLNTNYIDLYQIHWPYKDMPLQEALYTLNSLKEEGLIRYIGLSNFSLADFKYASSLVQIDTYQGLFNIIEHNATSYHNATLSYKSSSEIIPYCQQTGKTFLAYSPLMQGLLGGNFVNFTRQDDRMGNINFKDKNLLAKNLEIVEKLKDFANKKNCTASQLAISYILHINCHKLILCGMRKPSYVEDILLAKNVSLSREEIEELDRIVGDI